ncbi:methylmalonyl-CoA carboxyltransferase [Actinopolyspora erythraea]|uniref:Methylmalonyl-CoA carboxyltransferase n=1 Tax=Actinopolyspora erythraea TaxID=414996 RepID=A0A099D7K8_9ACTN|nr:acyl-CoA carboxylase subunit beta [Actinopolyspora erythraea]ASU78386.1 methylmalonyl-CoA carboxyltransferase [Actinopolyspora erythraea]KGI81916.1 methylmalonyl-CoA carboxyltransferase [Actinopolyspora erythraea]
MADEPRGTAERIDDLERRRAEAVSEADEAAAAKQHPRGKHTARERIRLLVDEGSFVEVGEFALRRGASFGAEGTPPHGDGVVTGYATVDGRRVCLFSHDFTTFGGSMGEVFGEKVLRIMDMAMKAGCPVIGINDSGGARIQEGVVSLAYYAELSRRNSKASGVVPQISVIMGPCAGGAVYTPALTDFTVMVDRTSRMFVTGPDVVRSVTGESVSAEELGGAEVNGSVSGNAHYVASDEADAFDWVRALLTFLPPNNLTAPPECPAAETAVPATDLDAVVPDSPNRSYDMRRVLAAVLDEGELLEVHSAFAPNILCGFGRLGGHSVGVVANQPLWQSGIIDIDASEKAARFVRFCDAFNIPLLTFADVPGYLPGREQEQRGVIRRGAKLIYAYSEATVPKITVVTRKAYGGGYAVMGSKHLGADVNLAWPTAEIAVMGAEGAVELLHRDELSEAAANGVRDTVRAKLVAEYRATMTTPYVAAERGYVDSVIRPSRTRERLVEALRMLEAKREESPPKKHSTMPL